MGTRVVHGLIWVRFVPNLELTQQLLVTGQLIHWWLSKTTSGIGFSLGGQWSVSVETDGAATLVEIWPNLDVFGRDLAGSSQELAGAQRISLRSRQFSTNLVESASKKGGRVMNSELWMWGWSSQLESIFLANTCQLTMSVGNEYYECCDIK